ncbi:MAG: ClpP family protease [Chitinophagaceae bacterium]
MKNFSFEYTDNEHQETIPKIDNFLLKKQEKLFFEKRSIYLWGTVDDSSAKDIVNKLLLLDADNTGEEIKFFIHTPGGAVGSGMIIYDTMQMIKSPVSTICMGLAASMGSLLLSGGAKENRFIFTHGEVMIHQPLLGGMMQGVALELEIEAEQVKITKDLIANILAKNCGQKLDKVMSDIDRNYWMNAKQSIEYGIIDKILTKL